MTNHAARLTQTLTPPRFSQFLSGGDRANNFPRGPAAWKIIQRTAFGAGLLLVAIASAGCGGGPKFVKAGGTVKYKDKPIPGADIIMMSDASSSPSLARTDDQGRFTVTTDGKPGALVGSYRVA